MKRKLTTKYMVVFSISVLMVVLIWLGLVYIMIFSGKYTNQHRPQYLINRFEKYVDLEVGIELNEEGRNILNENK